MFERSLLWYGEKVVRNILIVCALEIETQGKLKEWEPHDILYTGVGKVNATYALTKRLGEDIFMHCCSVYKLPAISLRLFNVYGPRSRTTGAYGAVFGVFLAQKIKHLNIWIFYEHLGNNGNL